MPRAQVSRYTVVCNKTELICLFTQVSLDDLEGVFIAGINKDIISEEFLYSLEHTASSMVKNGISDISISINFPENEMVISLSKEKDAVMSIKDKIRNIYRD